VYHAAEVLAGLTDEASIGEPAERLSTEKLR